MFCQPARLNLPLWEQIQTGLSHYWSDGSPSGWAQHSLQTEAMLISIDYCYWVDLRLLRMWSQSWCSSLWFGMFLENCVKQKMINSKWTAFILRFSIVMDKALYNFLSHPHIHTHTHTLTCPSGATWRSGSCSLKGTATRGIEPPTLWLMVQWPALPPETQPPKMSFQFIYCILS